LSRAGRQQLLEDFRALPRQRSEVHRQWERWLKENDQHLSITFHSDCAADTPSATLITPQHPLVRQASALFSSLHEPMVFCEFATSEIQPGSYPFAIYQWRYHGFHEDLRFVPVTGNERVTKNLLKWLEHASEVSHPTGKQLDDAALSELERHHHRQWTEAREQHHQRIEQIVSFRQESLDASHRVNMEVRHSRLNRANEEKIRRMREGEVNNAQADYERRSEELGRVLTRADITAKRVARGILIVTGV
jgi:hypothetical protein